MSAITDEFHRAAGSVAADDDQRAFMRKALGGYENTRAGTEARFTSWPAARDAAAALKWDALENLHALIQQFVDNLERRGVKVCWAEDAVQARSYILEVVRAHGARSIIKSKCMTSEEIHLNDLLEHEGFNVIESDLGEYIVQLRKEAPYHFVFPSMHLRRGQIDDLFVEKHGYASNEDPEALTMEARRVLRRKYLEADIGFTGANFGIAETGMISITENEGNARLTTALPKVHIALMGIEKVIPTLDDLGAAAADARHRRHRPAADLLQLAVLRPAQRRRAGRPGGVPPRPARQPPHAPARRPRAARRAALHPLRRLPERLPDLQEHRRAQLRHHLPGADRLGHHPAPARPAGLEAPLARLVAVRRVHRHLPGAASTCTTTCCATAATPPRPRRRCSSAWSTQDFAAVMRRPWLYRTLTRGSRFLNWLGKPVAGTALDPVGAWRRTRTLPDPAKQSFKDYWKQHRKAGDAVRAAAPPSPPPPAAGAQP